MTNDAEFHANEIREEFARQIANVRKDMDRTLDRIVQDTHRIIDKAMTPKVENPLDPRKDGPFAAYPDRIIVGAYAKRFRGHHVFHYGLISPPDGRNLWSVTGRDDLTGVVWGRVVGEMHRDEADVSKVFDSFKLYAFSDVSK